MARVDDYKQALRLAKEKILTIPLDEQAHKSGATIKAVGGRGVEISFLFLTEPCFIKVNDQEVTIEGLNNREISLTDQVLVAHYFIGASGESETGEWITFRDIPDGHFYYEPFQKRTRDPFLKTFGTNPELFLKTAPQIGGTLIDGLGDVGFAFPVFPKITMRIILWRGDEEFPPDANILFDKNISSYLPVEDIAYMSGGVVYRMIGLARSRS